LAVSHDSDYFAGLQCMDAVDVLFVGRDFVEFVLIMLHSAATRPWHICNTVFPSAAASAQMKT